MTPEANGAASAPDEVATSGGRGRFVISLALLAVTLITAPLFLVAAWANSEITNTDRYVDSISSLADEPAVQQYLANELTAAFQANVDLDAILAEELPPALQPAVGTIATAIDGFVAAAANRFTASPAFKEVWVGANRAAHRVISRVLTGELEVAELENGQLTLDVGDALRRFQQRLVDEGFELAGRVDLSGVDRQVVLADSERLQNIEQARKAVGLLQKLVWVLAVVTLAAAVASVLVARKKAAALLRLAISLALVMVVVALGLGLARQALLSGVGGEVPTPVIGSFFDALSSSVRFALRFVFVLGLVTALLVVIVQLPGYARRWARPTQVAVGVLGVAALLVVENLTWGFVLLVLVAVAVTLAILEVLRQRGLDGQPDEGAAQPV